MNRTAEQTQGRYYYFVGVLLLTKCIMSVLFFQHVPSEFYVY